MKRARTSERKFTSHVIVIFLLAFIALLLLSEVCVFVILNILSAAETDVDHGTNAYTVVLYVIPGCAVALTACVVFLNNRTNKCLTELTKGLDKVANGNFDYRIESNSRNAFNAIYSDFNKMAEELAGVKSLRESFVHDFSHEFKTPIASINGFANLLLEGNVTEEERAQFLKIIADESARLSHLAESTLLMSNLDNLTFIGESAPYRLDNQIRDCVIMLSRRWEEKNIAITSDMDEVTFCGNGGMMQQVWINLLVNAFKFTPSGGEVSVTLKQAGDRIVATVADTGVGMTEEVRARVFDKYFQGDRSRSIEGNGLGLSIVKRICDLHGGEISVASVKGEGSAFTVILPTNR